MTSNKEFVKKMKKVWYGDVIDEKTATILINKKDVELLDFVSFGKPDARYLNELCGTERSWHISNRGGKLIIVIYQ